MWAIVELGNGTYATASADKTIKLWKKDGSGISTLTGKIIVNCFLLSQSTHLLGCTHCMDSIGPMGKDSHWLDHSVG